MQICVIGTAELHEIMWGESVRGEQKAAEGWLDRGG